MRLITFLIDFRRSRNGLELYRLLYIIGCGWETLGAYVNLGAYYVVGLPIDVILSFVLHVGGRVNYSSLLDFKIPSFPFEY